MKVFCINKNMYVDAWEVKKDWDEVTLRGEIRKLFSSILKDEKGEEIGWVQWYGAFFKSSIWVILIN